MWQGQRNSCLHPNMHADSSETSREQRLVSLALTWAVRFGPTTTNNLLSVSACAGGLPSPLSCFQAVYESFKVHAWPITA